MEAGHDLVLVCHRPEWVQRGWRALKEAYREGRLKTKDLEESLSRLKSVFQKMKAKKPVSGNYSDSQLGTVAK